MGTLVPPWYKEEAISQAGLLVAAFLFGASVGVAAYVSAKAGCQSYRLWHRRHRANAYIAMLWAARLLKVGLVIAIGLINVSVFVIWVPARLQISERWVRINLVWDRVEKALFAVIDMCLNAYFMWLVKSKLVADGLTQYNLVYRYNLVMSCLSVSLDVMLIGLMSLPDDAVYLQAHPLVFLIKLNIEMNMAELLGKVVKKSAEQRAAAMALPPPADVCQPQLVMDVLDRECAKDIMPSSGSGGSSRGGGGGSGGGGQMHELNMDILNESGSTRPRSSTKGPLDDEGPLASPLSTSQTQRTLSLRSHPRSPGPGSPMISRSPARSLAHSPAPTGKRSLAPGSAPARPGPKDFSYLLHPETYHALTPLNTPAPFRNPPNPPSKETPIPDLLSQGYFRAAAIAAAHRLTSGAVDPSDHAQIFDLLYTRLACLTLLDATALAAQEVKALGDLHSSFYYSSPGPGPISEDTMTAPAGSSSAATTPTTTTTTVTSPTHLVPWPLRLLAVRLQALGFGDPRRAVMSYYDLAREARARLGEAKAAHDHSASELWKERLADLGVRVAGVLVEMDDLTGAVEHLETLKKGSGGGGMRRVRRALLYLHLGDVGAARECVGGAGDGGVGGGVEERVVTALCDMADGEYEAALGRWTELKETVDDEMVAVNMAVCLLYVGRMQEGKALLEQLVDSGRSSHTLLFNLTTMYELCTDRSRALKVRLSERVAASENRGDGWEKTNADFKL
ncbi:hypothetical protein N658DRAFT_479250 [Parathielavia hyrcaniae]|uniref:Trafficking protein particle complex subunit 12 n=1 Tax=Parathielavia hyrcaniae TaxID=113614 RepID=A0AAN6PV64_9PEZI|nr:hypothetical protein N658DRAFT_479250 [Parathielavia hyrcaniae]